MGQNLWIAQFASWPICGCNAIDVECREAHKKKTLLRLPHKRDIDALDKQSKTVIDSEPLNIEVANWNSWESGRDS